LVKQSTRLVIILAVILFISGLTAGFILGRMTCPRPPHPPHKMQPPSPDKIKAMLSERMFERLHLTAEQQKKVSPAIDKWFDRLQELRKQEYPAVQKVFNELLDHVEKVLTAEQQREMISVRKEVVENLSRGPFAGPPPHDKDMKAPPPPDEKDMKAPPEPQH